MIQTDGMRVSVTRMTPDDRPDNSLPRELLCFGAIGVGGLFVDMAALTVAMHAAGLTFYTGRVVSYFVAASFTWYMNRVFTFRSRGRPGALRQWATFLAANAVGGIVNYTTSAMVVAVGRHGLDLPELAHTLLPYIGVAAGALTGMTFNFMANKWFVFRRR